MTDADGAEATLFPTKAGDLLRAAREGRGMTLAAVAERTRVPLRHLEAIEQSNYEGLPSPTYAAGFARAYARVVGADEVAIARQVREESAAVVRPPEYEPYVTADPARLPSRGLAIVSAGVALAVLILAGLWIGSRWLSGRDAAAPAPVALVSAAPTPTPAATPTGGQVRLAATDAVWLKVYDAGKTLYLGTMKAGDGFDVPAAADHPKIDVGRPDKLAVTLNGAATPPLGDGSRALKAVPVDGAAIAARLSGATATPLVTPAPISTPAAERAAAASPAAGPAPHHAARARAEDEVERANRASARAAARGAPPPSPTPSTSPAP